MNGDDEAANFASVREQRNTEQLVKRTAAAYEKLFALKSPPEPIPLFDASEHVQYINSFLNEPQIPEPFLALASSTPWIVYWCVHTLQLLHGNSFELSDFLRERFLQTLRSCRQADGGFSGNAKIRTSHLASTYAAVCAIATIGGEDFFALCDAAALRRLLQTLKHPTAGTFCMHVDGETDVRATYCALVVADIVLGLETCSDLLEGVKQAIARCQTHEGGFGPTPYVEAHGGYTFCAVASLRLLQTVSQASIASSFDLPRALEWCVNRQLAVEGGFNGRPHKLVDGCYSFWVGASIAMLQEACGVKFDGCDALFDGGSLLFDQQALQEFVLLCCQALDGSGGFADRPEDATDLYHTCYCLSGLSIAQEAGAVIAGCTRSGHAVAFKDFLRGSTAPVYNVSRRAIERMKLHFGVF